MKIEVDDLTRPAVHALLAEHLSDMHATSPAESVHALDLSDLRGSDVTVWTAWDADMLLGIAALKELSADHGELFGEHGGTGHGAALHQEAIHIPMALVAPGLGARTEPRPVSLLDLTATFCALAGADRSGLDGYSLLGPALGRPYPADRPIFSEAVRFYRRGGRTSVHLQAMIRGHHKLTWDRLIVTDTLIDLRDDPGEIDNLALRRPVRTAELARVLRYWVARGERLNPSPPSRPAPSP